MGDNICVGFSLEGLNYKWLSIMVLFPENRILQDDVPAMHHHASEEQFTLSQSSLDLHTNPIREVGHQCDLQQSPRLSEAVGCSVSPASSDTGSAGWMSLGVVLSLPLFRLSRIRILSSEYLDSLPFVCDT